MRVVNLAGMGLDDHVRIADVPDSPRGDTFEKVSGQSPIDERERDDEKFAEDSKREGSYEPPEECESKEEDSQSSP